MYVVIRPTWSKVKKGREGRGEIGGADYGKDESTEGGQGDEESEKIWGFKIGHNSEAGLEGWHVFRGVKNILGLCKI